MLKKLMIALIFIGLIYLPISTLQPATSLLTKNVSAASTRPLKYYMVDRVVNNADFSQLSTWGINTAVVDFDVNGKAADWSAVFTTAAKYNINIVIWPSDYTNPRPNCDWEAPFPVSSTGDITKVKPLIDVASQYSNFIGMVNGHESFWSCTNMSFDEMAGLKTQLKAYALSKGRDIKIWNYINSLYWESMLPTNQIARIMDVAVTWKHCAGNAEGTCDTGSDSALAQIISDRARLTSIAMDAEVQLVYLMDTFTYSSPYTTKFTLSQLENYSCEFLKTNDLDGFSFYTWDAGWWTDLHSWTDLQPAIPYIVQNCSVNSTAPTSTIAPTKTTAPTLTSSPTPTISRTVSPTVTVPVTSTPVITPTWTRTIAPTKTIAPTLAITPTVTTLQPKLISPINRSRTSLRRPIFKWNSVTGATSYTIQLSLSSSFYSAISATVTSTTYQPSSYLSKRTYYWRVRANNGPWSTVWSVTIK